MTTAAPHPDIAVAALPVLGVEPGHVAEARRALHEQGREASDDAIVRLLWTARALPAALDVLSGAPTEAGPAALGAPAVEVADGGGGALYAVARMEEDQVVVEIIEQRALFAAADDDAPACCIVTIPVTRKEAGDGVALHRFTIGPP